MGRGDRLVINTPGGGAWGEPIKEGEGDAGLDDEVSEVARKIRWAARGSLIERESLQAGFGGL